MRYFFNIRILCVLLMAIFFTQDLSAQDKATLLKNHAPFVEWNFAESSDPAEVYSINFQKELEQAYLEIWFALNESVRDANPNILRPYFLDSAQKRIPDQFYSQQKLNITQVDLSHKINVNLISPDLSVVAFTDEDVLVKRMVYSHGSKEFSDLSYKANFSVIMVRENQRWKVKYMHTLKMGKFEFPEPAETLTNNFSTNTTAILKDGIPFYINGINYYPQENPWLLFWENYDEQVVAQDLLKIKRLGLNAIRIFFPYEQFGKAKVNVDFLDRANHLINLAAENDLSVMPTLFDFPAGYSIYQYPETYAHLIGVLNYFKSNSNIIGWDIKNEPDRDFEKHGEENVMNWLTFANDVIKHFDSNRLVTVGWSTQEYLHRMEDDLDFLSFHHYQKSSSMNSPSGLKPILLQEFGASTYNSYLLPGGNNERQQAAIVKVMIEKSKALNYAGQMVWTLYDFPNLDPAVFGSKKRIVNKESQFGLIDADGNAKPAFETIRNPAKTKSLSLFQKWKPFYTTCLAFALMSFLFLWVTLRFLLPLVKKVK